MNRNVGEGSGGSGHWATQDPANFGQRPGPSGQQGNTRYQFSPDEIRALRECNRESFYYRCLPLGTAFATATFVAVKQGYLKASPRWGAGPKMFGASLLGYILGKFSYQRACAEKLMALPNSQLAEMLRQKKGQMGFSDTLTMEPSFTTLSPQHSEATSDSRSRSRSSYYTDVGDMRPMSALDNEAPSNYMDVDASKNFDTTNEMLNDENLPPKSPQYFTSYDDLRRQNRMDYEMRQHPSPSSAQLQQPLSGPGGLGSEDRSFGSRRNVPSSYPASSPTDPKLKNKYGDVWDDKPE